MIVKGALAAALIYVIRALSNIQVSIFILNIASRVEETLPVYMCATYHFFSFSHACVYFSVHDLSLLYRASIEIRPVLARYNTWVCADAT